MRKFFITLISFSISFCTNAQIFTGSGGTIQNNGQYTYFPISVSSLNPSQLSSTFGIEEVCIDINHPVLSELNIYLQSPSGTFVELNYAGSSSGSNYISTCFDSKLNTSITTGNAPYSGSYKPVGYLGRFNNGQNGNGNWNLVVHDYNVQGNSGSVLMWSIKFGIAPSSPVSFTSSNLPIISINTNNQTITDTEIIANMEIIDNGSSQRNYLSDTPNDYNGKIAIHVRGSSSKVFAKKPYSIEIRNVLGNVVDAQLLKLPAESDWALIPAYSDKTLIRNPLTYDLYRLMGHYSPRLKYVELVLNDEYRGIYTLMEKPKRGKERIDIAKLSLDDNLEPSISGGYILKIDRPNEPGWYSLYGGNASNNAKFYYQYVYPKDTAITYQQKAYIKDFMDNFETVMNSPSFSDPVNGYPKYIDVGSFIDFFIINELSKNVDGYKLSTYLYKDNIENGGKLYIGPVWDYDIAWHNSNYGNAFDPTGWQYNLSDTAFPAPTWWKRFIQDPEFVNRLNCRWNELRQGILKNSYMTSYIDQTAATLNESQQRNFIQWPILGAYIFPNPQTQPGATYQSEIDDLKNWIWNRTGWLDSNIPGTCTGISVDEKIALKNIRVFPNPFLHTFNITYTIYENSNVQLEVTNVIGKKIYMLSEGKKSAGVYQREINTEQLTAGIYFVKILINDQIFCQKITKIAE